MDFLLEIVAEHQDIGWEWISKSWIDVEIIILLFIVMVH